MSKYLPVNVKQRGPSPHDHIGQRSGSVSGGTAAGLDVRTEITPAYLRGHVFGRFYSDGGVPLPRGQHRHLVQELIDARHQVISVFGFVCNIVEHLQR